MGGWSHQTTALSLYGHELKSYILCTKRAHRSKIFRLLSGWVKIHEIPHVMRETTSQFFFKLSITVLF